MGALSIAECRRFLSVARQSKWFALFALALTTGIRPSEYLALTWTDIDWQRGTASVRPIRLYDLRHTAATLAVAAGVSVKVTSDLLGHASVSLTLERYSHVLPGIQHEAAARVESLLVGRSVSGAVDVSSQPDRWGAAVHSGTAVPAGTDFPKGSKQGFFNLVLGCSWIADLAGLVLFLQT